MNSRNKIITISTAVVFIIIISYAFFNARLLIAGPKIIINQPESGSVFDSPLIEIQGEAYNTSFISMNGHSIYINEQGQFKEKLLLPPGTSIIKLDARDRFDRTTETTLWYIYKGNSPEPIMPDISSETASSSTTASSSSVE